MEKIIMHIDVNNAFLSWTAIDLINKGYKKDIRNYPSVIAGNPDKRQGIILAKSPIAKKYNIKTGETLYSARRKCDNLEVYKGDYSFYSKMSKRFIDLLKKYTPDIEQVSIDECFIDYTSVYNLYGDPLKFACKIQKEIYNTFGFTVNIGISHNKLLSKMASDFSKPNKIHTLYKNEIESKMWPLDVGELFGIGKKSAELLKGIGINTIYDLAHTDINFLYKSFKNQAISMVESANGIDNSIVDSNPYIPKGIGNEVTLESDVYEENKLYKHLLVLSESVSSRIIDQGKRANTIVVTLKTNKFKRISHQKKLKNAISNGTEIYEISKKILSEMDISEGIRLIGIRLDNLTDDNGYQISLFESPLKKKEDAILDKTVHNLKNKYGSKIIKKASIVNDKELKR